MNKPTDLMSFANALLAEMRKRKGADPQVTLDLYNGLLWEILTAPIADLRAFSMQLLSSPMIDLPVPVQVVALRILGLLTSADEAETLRCIRAGISRYCSPKEEEQALAGIPDISDI